MRALVLQDIGTPPLVADIPQPQPGSGEVLVHVEAASVNGFGLSVAAGHLQGMMAYEFPVVLGKDFAGEVSAVGEGVSGFKPGDRVFGVVMKPTLHDGSMGEYVTVLEGFGVTRIPEGLETTTAGALGLAGTTALMAVEALNLSPSDTLLISGATGGVGVLAIQLSAARGATVIATAKPGEEALVTALGAAHAVDYTGDLMAAVRAVAPDGVDAVLHLAGKGRALASLLVPGGRLASARGFSQEQLGAQDATGISLMASPDAATLDRLAAEVVSGRLTVPIERSFTLDGAPEALQVFTQGKRGKLVMTI